MNLRNTNRVETTKFKINCLIYNQNKKMTSHVYVKRLMQEKMNSVSLDKKSLKCIIVLNSLL